MTFALCSPTVSICIFLAYGLLILLTFATVAEKVAAGEVAWEGKMADATVDSWKDEFALVVLLAPAILVFIPGMKEYVKEGFDILATLPEWYQYLLYIAISASFGIKGVGQAAKMFKKK